MERTRNGRVTQSRYGARRVRRAAPSSAPSASARCPRATTSPSSRSCCARPASRSSASSSSTARSRTRTSTWVPGKVEELKPLLKAADANLVACDDELTPRQERNLEKELGLPVIDRTAVILDIFADHAHSAEGKMQVELAQLEYNMARMRGLWTHLERLGAGRGVGGIGTRGPGESQIETDRRLARDRIHALKRRLDDVRGHRAVQRAERERAHLPNVALAGYTNAGKSTLLNALTGADGRRARPPLPHARPDDPHAAPRGPHLPGDRHGRLHPQAARTSWSTRSARRSRRPTGPT